MSGRGHQEQEMVDPQQKKLRDTAGKALHLTQGMAAAGLRG